MEQDETAQIECDSQFQEILEEERYSILTHEIPPNTPLSGSPLGSPKSEYIDFTDKSIKALKPTEKRRIVWAKGLPGLGLRVTPKGTKSFVYKYDIDGQDRWLTFGRYPKVKLAEALAKYGEALAKVDVGDDPAEEQVRINRDARTAMTVKQLADDYIEKYAKPRKRSWEEDERILEFDVLPKMGSRRASKVTRRDVLDILDEIVARGAPIQANRTLAVLRRMFNFAIDRDVLLSSPCHRLKAPSPESPKDRYLTLEEIRAFWTGLDDAPISKRTKQALKLLLLTLQRCSEVTGMNVRELNMKASTWTIPADRTKNKRAHLVPLSPGAKDIVKLLIDGADKDGNLFPGRGKAENMTSAALSRAIARNQDHFGIRKFTPHDLRRTGSTQLAAFKVTRFDRDRVLNHTDQSIGSVYDIYGYEDEKRAALSLWDSIVKSVVATKSDRIDIDKLKKTLKV